MNVQINHHPLELPDGATLADALAQQAFTPPFAAAVNTRFVPRTAYGQTPLCDGDRIDVITPVTGG